MDLGNIDKIALLLQKDKDIEFDVIDFFTVYISE